MPSGAKRIRDASPPDKLAHGSATKISLTSRRALPSNLPRASAVEYTEPLAPAGFGFDVLYARYTRLFEANFGCRAISSNPLVPPAWTFGTPAIGSGSRTPLRIIRRRPARSVTSMSPFGSHTMLQGCDSPFVTTETRIRVPPSEVV